MKSLFGKRQGVPVTSHDLAGVDNIEGRFYSRQNKEMFFRDGKRRIDFVLVYRRTDVRPDAVSKRNAFLSILAQKRIEIEVEDCDGNIIAGTGQNLLDEHINEEEHTRVDPTKDIWPIKNVNSIRMDSIDAQLNPWQISLPDRVKACLKRRLKGFHVYTSENTKRIQYDESDNLVYIKLHASWPLMISYADDLQFRKPLKKASGYSRIEEKRWQFLPSMDMKRSQVVPISQAFTSVFQKSKLHLFDMPTDHKDEFFTQAERALVLDYLMRRVGLKSAYMATVEESETPAAKTETDLNEIESGALKSAPVETVRDLDLEMEREKAAKKEEKRKKRKRERKEGKEADIDLNQLIKENIFIASYPLHEPLPRFKVDSKTNTRSLLFDYWASYRNIFRRQPLDYVRLYFGESVAFYFAWTGFYTQALVPATIVGLAIFFSGIYRFFTDELAAEICGSDLLMCPQCRNCSLWLLREACTNARLSRLLDHEGTIFFAVFMALWAAIFQELWMREQNRLAYRWDMQEIAQVEEPPRPEYISLIGTKFPPSRDFTLGNPEPHIPFWRRKVPVTLVTISVILFSIVLCIAILVGIIFFKIFMGWYLKFFLPAEYLQYSSTVATVLGAMVSLVCIQVLAKIYFRFAHYLTRIEHHRTQTQYDNALTLKLYILQFFNFYSVICYIAFFKGVTSAVPGDPNAPVIASYGCLSGDCIFDLFLQMVIIMIGKQLVKFILAMFMPIISRFMIKLQFFIVPSDKDQSGSTEKNWDKLQRAHLYENTLAMCKHDFTLATTGSNNPVFPDYLKMLLQFGFMTLFVPVFPIAPLFALLNNMLEIRADAQKFLRTNRRPVPARVKDIGIWILILRTVSRVAVRTNFIPRLVYRIVYRPPDKSGLEGYMHFILSYMSTNRFSEAGSAYTYCRYWDFRNPPWNENAFARSAVYYHVMAARFIFIFFYENIVTGLTAMLCHVVPNMPRRLALIMKHEAAQTNEIIIHAEMNRAARKLRGEQTRPLTHCVEFDYGEEYAETIELLMQDMAVDQEDEHPEPQQQEEGREAVERKHSADEAKQQKNKKAKKRNRKKAKKTAEEERADDLKSLVKTSEEEPNNVLVNLVKRSSKKTKTTLQDDMAQEMATEVEDKPDKDTKNVTRKKAKHEEEKLRVGYADDNSFDLSRSVTFESD